MLEWPPMGQSSSSPFQVTVEPSSPPAGAIDWHPGHYLSSSISVDNAEIDTLVAYVNARGYLRGVNIRILWPALEPTKDNYSFSQIDRALNGLDSGKYLWVQLQTALFGSGHTLSDVVPAYLQTAAYDGGAYDAGTSGIRTKLWVPAVMDRKIALIQALAARYNSSAQFEGIVTCESAQALSNDEGGSGYSPDAFLTQLERLFPAARAAFTRKNLMFFCNYISGTGLSADERFGRLLDAGLASDCIASGPDTRYLEGGTTGAQYQRGELGSTDYRGRMGIGTCEQFPGMADTAATAAGVVQWCFTTQRANYAFWTHLPSSLNFDPIMAYLAANPNTFVSACPSEFPGCAT